jgi:CheY-like chemotaxis protein
VRKRVLVVDDDPCLQNLLQVILELEDYEVILAENGLVALEKLETITPDLILLDLSMPHMDGLTFAQAVQQRSSHASIPILILTVDVNAKAEAEQMGCNNFCTKPFELHQFLSEVAKLLYPLAIL